jgi:hypothetical protein
MLAKYLLASAIRVAEMVDLYVPDDRSPLTAQRLRIHFDEKVVISRIEARREGRHFTRNIRACYVRVEFRRSKIDGA